MHVVRQSRHETILVEDMAALESDALMSVSELFGTQRTDCVVAVVHSDWSVWSEASLAVEWRSCLPIVHGLGLRPRPDP